MDFAIFYFAAAPGDFTTGAKLWVELADLDLKLDLRNLLVGDVQAEKLAACET